MTKTLQTWCTQNGILKPVKACTGNSATCECGTMQHRLQQREPTPPLQDGQQPNPLDDTQAELDAITREMDVIYGRWPGKDNRDKREELLQPLRDKCVEIGQRRYRLVAAVSQDGQQAPSDRTQRRVVCAAIRAADGEVLLGIRHYSADMHRQIKARKDGAKFCRRHDPDQGFVDQWGVYLTREEAYAVAQATKRIAFPKACGQGLDGPKLYSEGLY